MNEAIEPTEVFPGAYGLKQSRQMPTEETALQAAQARYDEAYEWGKWDECLRILDEEIEPLQALQALPAEDFATLVEVTADEFEAA